MLLRVFQALIGTQRSGWLAAVAKAEVARARRMEPPAMRPATMRPVTQDFNAHAGTLRAGDDVNHVGQPGMGTRNDCGSRFIRWLGAQAQFSSDEPHEGRS